MGVGGKRHTPATLPPGKTSFYKRLGGLHGRSERMRKISPTPDFDPRTVQPVASRYTDYAVPPHVLSLLIYRSSILERAYRAGWCSGNALGSYSRGARLQCFRWGHWLPWLGSFCSFLHLPHRNVGMILRLDYNLFYRNPFQFVIRLSFQDSKQ
jgi:hypothetical protein